MPDPLTRVPISIVANTSVSWRYESTDFDPADGWALDYAFEGPQELDISAVVGGDGFLVDLTATDTALVEGFYAWQAFASRVGPPAERVAVAAGQLQIVPDLALLTNAGEQKTHNQIMCDALEAQLQGRATDGQTNMTINGRSIGRIPILELEQLLNTYRRKAEADRSALAQGARPGKRRRVKVRF